MTVVLVGNSFLSNTTEVITELSDPINGIFSTYALFKLIMD